jgi:hypothetical protein
VKLQTPKSSCARPPAEGSRPADVARPESEDGIATTGPDCSDQGHRFHWQLASPGSLLLLAIWAYHFPEIGVTFMPMLDEGTTLDMPITIPRAGVTDSADDLKARDAFRRGFPEAESVVGKAGRADTAMVGDASFRVRAHEAVPERAGCRP